MQQDAQQRQLEADVLARREHLATQAFANEQYQAELSAARALRAFEISQESSQPSGVRKELYQYGLQRKESSIFHNARANNAYVASRQLEQDKLATLGEADELLYEAALEAEHENAERARNVAPEAGPSPGNDRSRKKSGHKEKAKQGHSTSLPRAANDQTKEKSRLQQEQGKENPFSATSPIVVFVDDTRFTKNEKLKQRVIETLRYENLEPSGAPRTPLLKPGEGIPKVIHEFLTGEKLVYLPNEACRIILQGKDKKDKEGKKVEGKTIANFDYERPVWGATVRKILKEGVGDEYHYIVDLDGYERKRVRVPIDD